MVADFFDSTSRAELWGHDAGPRKGPADSTGARWGLWSHLPEAEMGADALGGGTCLSVNFCPYAAPDWSHSDARWWNLTNSFSHSSAVLGSCQLMFWCFFLWLQDGLDWIDLTEKLALKKNQQKTCPQIIFSDICLMNDVHTFSSTACFKQCCHKLTNHSHS